MNRSNEEFNNEITDVNHIDGNKDNNSLDNLEACSIIYNIQHAIITGLRNNKGENCYLNKYSEKTIHKILKLLEDGYDNNSISNKLNIPLSTISGIKTGKTWTHISNQYNLPNYIHRQNIDIVECVIKSIIKGLTNKQISSMYNIDHKYISLIRNKKRHKELYDKVEKCFVKTNTGSTTIENNDDYYTIEIH